MAISLLVISATDPNISHPEALDGIQQGFFTPKVCKQLQRFLFGWLVFFFFAGMDYNKLREWAPGGYVLMILSLVGLFFVPAIQNVHRWYRLPIIGASFQPSEFAKLLVVITLSWYLEKQRHLPSSFSGTFKALIIVGIPFLLILKQPDLGTALVLCPITCVMLYLGNMHPLIIRTMLIGALLFLCCILTIFLGAVSHEDLKPYATKVLKEYQYERLNPDSHHGRAAQIAIGAGGISGSGWRSSIFTARGWLPYAYTDSVFAAFGEEYGLLGMLALLALFYALIYYGFQITVLAKDAFGRMLSAGVTIYIAMHIIVNVSMMAGLLPITGVPLPLISYGGSSVFVTMAAFGILQSIYARRFMF
jgi:rod shape determining protein RodA